MRRCSAGCPICPGKPRTRPASFTPPARTCSALINDVLDLAKIEAGKLDLHPTAVDLPTLLKTVANICRVRAVQKGLSFAYEHVGPERLGVRADEKRLMQVLLNLLGNAIKFTEQGGVTLRVEVLEPPEDKGARCASRSRTPAPASPPSTCRASSRPSSRSATRSGTPRARASGSRLPGSSSSGWAAASRSKASSAKARSSR